MFWRCYCTWGSEKAEITIDPCISSLDDSSASAIQGFSEGTPPYHFQSKLHLPEQVIRFTLLIFGHSIIFLSSQVPPIAPPKKTLFVVLTHCLCLHNPATTRHLWPNNESQPNAYDGHYYSPEMAFRAAAAYNHIAQYDSPVKDDKSCRMGKQDVISRKAKCQEQAPRNMKSTGGTIIVSYKKLCLFPNIRLLTSF